MRIQPLRLPREVQQVDLDRLSMPQEVHLTWRVEDTVVPVHKWTEDMVGRAGTVVPVVLVVLVDRGRVSSPRRDHCR
jgi:hypothetical protein